MTGPALFYRHSLKGDAADDDTTAVGSRSPGTSQTAERLPDSRVDDCPGELRNSDGWLAGSCLPPTSVNCGYANRSANDVPLPPHYVTRPSDDLRCPPDDLPCSFDNLVEYASGKHN